MRVVLLGTAAEGGFPRWNCVCALCAAARDGKLPSRTQESVALTGNGRDWWLLNASPDIRSQLTATSALWPVPGPRTPLRGVLLTDAGPGHIGGLGELRGGAGLKIYAAPPVLATLAPARAPLDRYAPWDWYDAFAEGGFVLAGGLVATAHPVGSAAPRYVPARIADDRWLTAYRVEDLVTGGVLVYAPCVAVWNEELDDLCADADCILLDGTRFTAGETDEMMGGMGETGGTGGPARGPSGRRREPGPLPVTGPDGTLAALARHPAPRRIYTHLGGANPLLDPASAAREQVAAAGVEVLLDGDEFMI
ncbi:pyrroloquinoline quinone biosynthesis protein PqqB [Streptomyces sp. YIM S03343]